MNELKNIVEYLENNKGVWNGIRNLKLYNVISYDMTEKFPLCATNSDKDDYFDWFCNESYSNFKLYLENECIDINILEYIGSTSSFYIGKFHEAYNIRDLLMQLSDAHLGDLNLLTLENVKEQFDDIFKVAEFIDDFKKNQVKYFEGFLEYIEADLQEELNKKEERLNIIKNILSKTKNILTESEKDIMKSLIT